MYPAGERGITWVINTDLGQHSFSSASGNLPLPKCKSVSISCRGRGIIIYDHVHTAGAGRKHDLTLWISETLCQAKWK